MIRYTVYCVKSRQWKSEQYDQTPFGQPVRCLKYEKQHTWSAPSQSKQCSYIF